VYYSYSDILSEDLLSAAGCSPLYLPLGG